MNKYLYFLCCLVITIGFVQCSIQDGEDDSPLTSDKVKFSVTPVAGDAYRFAVKNETENAFIVNWDFGNGQTSDKMIDTVYYPFMGEYNIVLTAYDKFGSATSAPKTVTIDQNDPRICNIANYNALTGGCNALEGKVWIFDPVNPMNFGGPPVEPYNAWWNQKLNQQAECMKNDEYVFSIFGQEFIANHKGDMWGVLDGNENHCVSFEEDKGVGTWNLYQENGKLKLSVSNGLTIAWADGEGVYTVMELTENKLWIQKSCCGGEGVRNYVLVPKEGAPDPEVPEVKPYKSEDIYDNFEGSSKNIVWVTDAMEHFEEGYDNPDASGINTSAKVAKYVKGEGAGKEFGNVRFDLPFRINLTTRNKFTLKIYMPSSNNYDQELGAHEWSPYKKLTKQVALKLQNSTKGEPWVGQAERIAQVTVLDEWVEVEFDYSDIAEVDEYDRVVLQIGGEAHFNPGTFYFDDFKLKP